MDMPEDFGQFLQGIHDARTSSGDTQMESGLIERLAWSISAIDIHGPSEFPGSNSLDRYTDVVQIAQGGMGVVFRAFDPVIGRPVAIKMVRERQARKIEPFIRFMREARILGQLDHPGIPPIHDLGKTEDNRPYMVMKLIDGRSLDEILGLYRSEGAKDRFARLRRELLPALMKVMETLSYAHSQGIVHRDLKPSNIMIGEFGEVLVMDWGIAKILGAGASIEDDPDQAPAPAQDVLRTADGQIIGTPLYASPEQAFGKNDDIDHRSDLYSMGVLLFEVLTLRSPHETQDVHALLHRLSTGTPFRPSKHAPVARISRELDAVVSRATRRSVLERYQTMSEFRKDLDACIAGKCLDEIHYLPWERGLKWMGRNRAVSAAAAVALVCLTTFLAIFISGIQRERTLRDGLDKERGRALREEEVARNSMSDLGDAGVLAGLMESELEVWRRGYPDSPEEIETWIDEARKVLERREQHWRALESSRRELDAADHSRNRCTLEWQLEHREQILQDMEKLAVALGKIEKAVKGLERLESIQKRLEEEGVSWDETIRSVMNDPRYKGQGLEPLLGLLPLGPDPRSGLQEFWHFESGSRPVRDEEGRITMDENTSIVLVLLPGGMMLEPGGGAADGEDPRQDIPIEPFLISKFELTQGQWKRLSGKKNPSEWYPGCEKKFTSSPSMMPFPPFSLSHPVESVSWDECVQVLLPQGLDLPTSKQWEYAIRAGTRTTWWTGDSRQTLMGAENLADRSLNRWTNLREVRFLPWDDGYPIHAPVGSFRANPFGLHDMAGNVTEFCLDTMATGADSDRNPDGPSDPGEGRTQERVLRGGSWRMWETSARSDRTGFLGRSSRRPHCGVRPIRRFGR